MKKYSGNTREIIKALTPNDVQLLADLENWAFSYATRPAYLEAWRSLILYCEFEYSAPRGEATFCTYHQDSTSLTPSLLDFPYISTLFSLRDIPLMHQPSLQGGRKIRSTEATSRRVEKANLTIECPPSSGIRLSYICFVVGISNTTPEPISCQIFEKE